MKPIAFILIVLFAFSSCQKETPLEEKGISIKTLKSNGNSDGFAIDFNFNEFADPFKEALEELGLSENENSVFSDLFQNTIYVLTTGEGICEDNFEFQSSVFSLAWLNNTDDVTGTFDAFGAVLNVTNPENLDDGFEYTEASDLIITVESVLANQLIGSFKGIVGGESIEGSFDVPRKSCVN